MIDLLLWPFKFVWGYLKAIGWGFYLMTIDFQVGCPASDTSAGRCAARRATLPSRPAVVPQTERAHWSSLMPMCDCW